MDSKERGDQKKGGIVSLQFTYVLSSFKGKARKVYCDSVKKLSLSHSIGPENIGSPKMFFLNRSFREWLSTALLLRWSPELLMIQ